jgi:HSP20 family protein
MDNETKKFFEELAGVDQDRASEAGEEFVSRLTKSPAISVSERIKKEKKVEEAADVFDEEEGKLTIDVYQTPSEIVVESTIAGVKPEDLDIAINSESVTIHGKRERETKVSDEDYFYQECYWGKFSRSVILPQEIDAENATASLKNGVLIIRLPKLNRQKSKKLKVKLD